MNKHSLDAHALPAMSRLGLATLLIVLTVALGAKTVLAASVSSNVVARIGNTSGAIYVDNDVSGYVHSLPADSIFSDATFAAHYGNGTHIVNLANAALGISSNWSGTSVYGEPNRTAIGGGVMQFRDEIMVQSNSLALNSPVDISFAFYAASSLSVTHTNPDPSFGQTRYSVADLNFGASIRGTSSSANDVFISDGDQRHFQWLGSSIIQNGILDPNSIPLLQVNFTALVGDTIQLAINLNAETYGGANPLGASPVTAGSGYAALGLAFGATPISSDVSLQSTAFAGAFPAASAANFANAQSVLVAPVPVPAAIYLLAAGLLSFARFASRSKGLA